MHFIMKILNKISDVPYIIFFLMYFFGFRQEISTGFRMALDIIISLAIVLKILAWIIEYLRARKIKK